MIINVIAYRADGSDTCRGCEMGRSSSDLEIFNTESLTEAIEFIAKKELEDRSSKREYCSHEITVIVDGRVIQGGISSDWYPQSDYDSGSYENYDVYYTAIQLGVQIRVKDIQDARAKAEQEAKEKADKARSLLANAAKKDAAEKHRLYILAEYEKLNRTFPWGVCKLGDKCNCGGDTQEVRANCHNWRIAS